MPYEIAFTKRLEIAHPEEYFNTCCHGGDIVADQLLPSVQQRYSSIQHNLEDWGWFIWFKRGEVGLAIDIFCDDPAIGAFRIHLSSSKPRFLFLDSVVDTPELEELKTHVVGDLTRWIGASPRVQAVDNDFRPKRGAA